MNDLTAGLVSIATAIVGVALLAVLVSQRANTAGVLNAAGNAFSTALGAATGPVSGNSTGIPALTLPGYGSSGNIGGL